jgi:hypothetical protein
MKKENGGRRMFNLLPTKTPTRRLFDQIENALPAKQEAILATFDQSPMSGQGLKTKTP